MLSSTTACATLILPYGDPHAKFQINACTALYLSMYVQLLFTNLLYT